MPSYLISPIVSGYLPQSPLASGRRPPDISRFNKHKDAQNHVPIFAV
ncbi:hypothetical protein RSAG8_13954, partial [Rhizoctonia solani AG-8 WAC10335]